MPMKYPLASSTWGKEERDAVGRVVDSGMMTMGMNVRQFEESFAQAMGARYCVMVNSGSSANLLAVAALFYTRQNALRRQDEAIVPAVSWPTTYYPLHQYGLRLKFVDIDRQTLNYDIDKLRQAVTDKTKVIAAVNLLGNPNDFTAIRDIIGDRNIVLLEDNCESMGAEFKGAMTGSWGLMGTYSSFFSHHISTGEGGMVVTDDQELYHILLALRAHGWTRDLPHDNLIYGRKNHDPFYEMFNFVLPGYNVRPTEIAGAVGIEQLKKLPDFVNVRRQNADCFRTLFADDPRFIIQTEIGKSSWFGFSIVLRNPDETISRDDVVAQLINHNIDVRPIVAGNFVKNRAVNYFDYEISGSLENADFIDANGFFVGNHHFDIRKEIEYLKHVLDIALEGRPC